MVRKDYLDVRHPQTRMEAVITAMGKKVAKHDEVFSGTDSNLVIRINSLEDVMKNIRDMVQENMSINKQVRIHHEAKQGIQTYSSPDIIISIPGSLSRTRS